MAPQAVDAALADETMPMMDVGPDRRDMPSSPDASPVVRRKIDVPHAAGANLGSCEPNDDRLLRSLARQLDQLEEQHQQLRRLLDHAGRRRIDAPGV